MIVLLSCFINSYANDIYINRDIVSSCYSRYLSNRSSTGELDNRSDSVLISYNDLKIVNSKLIELKYEKEININLRNIISNDSIIIDNYSKLNKQLVNDYNKSIKQRNIVIGVCGFVFTTSIILLIIK